MSDLRDFTGKNRKFTGTNSIRLPNGTTAQRIGSLAGELRFNTTLNLAEYYTGTEWKAIDSPPTVTGVSVNGRTATNTSESQFINMNGSGNINIVVTGTGFDTSSAAVSILGTGGGNVTPVSTTINSASQITVAVTRSDFSESNDPYTVRVTNPSNLFAEIADVIDANALPVFATAAGTLGTINQNVAASGLASAAATDAESDTITYSISSGALPNGLSINSSSGAISGTPDTVENPTFTVSAATSKGTATRDFSINVQTNPYIVASGGTETTSGDYKIHTFTSPGTFTVSNAGAPGGSNSVEYLIVAGGGKGGRGCSGGGGGAGGYRTNLPSPATGGTPVSAQGYPVSVGSGQSGDGGADNPAGGGNGSNSSAFSITSAGGGGGAGNSSTPPTGSPGGSGGGGGHSQGGGGSGNQPPVSPPQGNPGGQSEPQGATQDDQGGGGGGASQSGADGPMAGGDGSPNAITGSAVDYAGGGGGGARDIPQSGPPGGPGGDGGGGNGGRGNPGPGGVGPATGQAGTANRGGGGGGANRYGPYGGPPGFGASGSGGSGIVVIRYKYQN